MSSATAITAESVSASEPRRPTYPRSLDGKVALVVGGAGAIGAATSRMLAAGGRHGRRDPPRPSGTRSGDGSSSLSSGTAMRPTRRTSPTRPPCSPCGSGSQARYGRLDILVNAAGFTKPVPHADLDALDDELIDRMFQVNWRGQFAAIRTFAPLLKASGDGLVVSISSIAAFTGVGSSIAYCAAKAGIDVMTKSLARALAPEVRVLAVSPGVVDTGFVPGRGADFNDKVASSTPLKRIATAEDIAAAITACATMLGYSTGHTIQVDGGRAL